MTRRPVYSDYKQPTRSPMDCITTLQQGVYFRNGAMNRDGHGPTDNPSAPNEGFGPGGKTIRIYHYRNAGER